MTEELELGPVLRLGRTDVRVGTCSWTDKTLVNDTKWYPKKSMSAAERLAYYAARFPAVEADSTYYRPPSEQLTSGWAERTPPGFRMNVKAYSLMTGHPTKPDTLWPDIRDELAPDAAEKRNVYPHHLPADAVDEVWRRFADSLTPLLETGRLGAVLLQYPVWFTPKRDNRHELSLARQRLGKIPVCVEFRSPRWLEKDDVDRTLQFLSDHDLALVVVDARRHVEGQHDHCRRTLQVPLRPAPAALVGRPHRGARRASPRGPRPHEQLLPGLRRPQRRRHDRHPRAGHVELMREECRRRLERGSVRIG